MLDFREKKFKKIISHGVYKKRLKHFQKADISIQDVMYRIFLFIYWKP